MSYPLGVIIGPYGTNVGITAYVSPDGNNRSSFYAVGMTMTQDYYVQIQLPDGTNITDWYFLQNGTTIYLTYSNTYADTTRVENYNIVACTGGRLGLDAAPGACVYYPITITISPG